MSDFCPGWVGGTCGPGVGDSGCSARRHLPRENGASLVGGGLAGCGRTAYLESGS